MTRLPGIFFIIVLLLIVFIGAQNAGADDPGIIKARLIQESERSYVLEADVSRSLVWVIKQPIFPDRFQVSELKFIARSGWIAVRAIAETNGEPLSSRDEILLPWARNGVALTTQRLDGSIHQGLFIRTLEGIRVSMNLLMPDDKTLAQVCIEHFKTGLDHFSFNYIHVLLVVVLFIMAPSNQAFKALLYYTFGQAFSMLPVDLGLPGFDLLFADILGLILILLLSLAAVKKQPVPSYLPLLFIWGLLHGLAYAQELSLLDPAYDHRLPALFMFNIGMDAGQYGLAALVTFVLMLIKQSKLKTAVSYSAGVLSVAILCLLFNQYVLAGKTEILGYGSRQNATRYSLPSSAGSQTGGQKAMGARKLTNPVMSYLTVEPYEVRQEILIRAREAVRFLGVDERGMAGIPIKSLKPVKEGILKAVKKANPISIDGKTVEPILARADFVTLGPAGVIVRTRPVPESLDNGIIGLTLVYLTSGLSDNISINWKLFSDTVKKVEATTTDPFGDSKVILSPDENLWQWKNSLRGFRAPVVEEINIEKHKLPFVSIVLFLFALVLSVLLFKRRGRLINNPVIIMATAVGLLIYPFVRFPADLAAASQWKPSSQRMSLILDGLLTNVYRSFDVRSENDVYDRLAVSVTGDQLANIYLENRRSLELENRGGARARVDEVDILNIHDIGRSDDTGFIVDAEWTVGGSVSHFGHTHYRQNRYRAKVWIMPVDGTWKIKDIELIDERRLL